MNTGNNLKIDFSSVEIKKCQEESLLNLMQYVKSNSKFYQSLFESKNIDIKEIKTTEDLHKLPVTTKEDLQLYNNDFLCVAEEKVIDYVTTSGTLGEPVTFKLTEKDLQRLAYNESRSLAIAGINKKDKVQITVTLDKRFIAGLAYFEGLRKIGAGIIRVGPGNPGLQWDTISRMNPTALIAVPSFILRMIEYADKNHIDYASSGIKKIICVGESIRNPDFSENEICKRILKKWPVSLYSTYASTEICTAFTECEEGHGGHLIPDLAIVECLDENNQPVPDGTPGELTVTTLAMDAMPLIRFKTGDITNINKNICKCGRASLRIGPILGRNGQMMKFKGTTLYPASLNNVMNGVEGVDSYFIEVYKNSMGLDELVANVYSEHPDKTLEKQIREACQAKLRVTPAIVFVTKATVEERKFSSGSRKPVEFIDRRK